MSKADAFKNYLGNAYYVLGTVLDIWVAVMNKTKLKISTSLYSVEEKDNESIIR